MVQKIKHVHSWPIIVIIIIAFTYTQDQRGKLASSGANNDDSVYSTLGEVRIQFELIYGL